MSINLGDQAPGFELAFKPGETINVADSIGREAVVLLFFPLAFSPVCTDEMCHFRDSWGEWEGLNAKVYGISVDSPFTTERFRQDQNIPFPLLSDFNKDVSAMYGALHEDLKGMKGVSKRSAFVIGPDGVVRYAWVSDDPRVQVNFDEIQAALTG
jgi:peroxiredoxin